MIHGHAQKPSRSIGSAPKINVYGQFLAPAWDPRASRRQCWFKHASMSGVLSQQNCVDVGAALHQYARRRRRARGVVAASGLALRARRQEVPVRARLRPSSGEAKRVQIFLVPTRGRRTTLPHGSASRGCRRAPFASQAPSVLELIIVSESAQSRASPRVAAAWSSVRPFPSTQVSASSVVGPQFSHRDAAAVLLAASG